ncbi:hypothetical protein [Hyphobacterium sp.]|uniref:hypothetical protein n=1 Tax=Hyphobacterium sp. TaxID=2004662 RepID=UPI00374A940E
MAGRTKPGFPFITGGILFLLVAACIAWLLTLERAPRISRSVIGLDGLVALLDAHGLETRAFHGGDALDPEGIGLRILPLYDNNTAGIDSTSPGGEGRYLRPEIQRIFNGVISTKIETLPTLVVMSKWRDGIRQAGFIHPDFLLSSDIPASAEPADVVEDDGNADIAPEDSTTDDDWDVEGFAGDGDVVELQPENEYLPPKTPGEIVVDEPADDYQQADFGTFYRLATEQPEQVEPVSLSPRLAGSASVYAPQYAVAPLGCEALIGEGERGLLFECVTNDVTYWLLSDPDLLNNHGLARGENARLAVELIRGLAGEGVVIVDYTAVPWLLRDVSEHARSLSDLLRYFEPPFRWLWLAGLGFLIILLWRGGVRGVPLVRRFTEGHGAARRTSLIAQARLMRRARADGALLKTLLSTHITTLAERILGRDARIADREARVLRRLDHADAEVGKSFRDVIAEIRNLPDTAGLDQTVPALSRLETAYKKALKLT